MEMDSIAQVKSEKAYLKPGSIQVAKNGIFICVEGKLMAIDHLKSDDEGVYFELGFKAGGSNCHLCNFPLLFGLFCMNPNCPCKN